VGVLGLVWGAKGPGALPSRFQTRDATRQMVELLARLGANFDRRLIEQRPDLSLARDLRHIEAPSDLRSRALLEAQQAYELLLRGEAREAARRFQHVQDVIGQNRALFSDQLRYVVRGYLAVAYLRMAEQDNCVLHHGSESCLLPIRGSGVHSIKDGARGAVREYREILSENPRDLAARWLLNIAYMALGEYPEEVPPEWLIPPATFESTGSMGRFLDVAPALRLDALGLAGGSVLEDFDGDGYVDLMTSSYGLDPTRDQLRYFHNNADGTFGDRTAEAGLTGLLGGMNLVQADYDNDGHVDVLVLRGAWLLGSLGQQPPSLLHNNGDGTFEDRTRDAGLLFFHPTQTAAWGDYDNDGWLDLFVGIESSAVPGFELPLYKRLEESPRVASKLFHNNRDGTFTEVAEKVGLSLTGYVKGVAWGDYDNDGLLDIAVTQLYGPTLLYRNEGARAAGGWSFARAFTLEPRHGYSVWFWDYDNNGWLDLFVGGYSPIGTSYSAGQVAAEYLGLPHTAERPRLFRNRRDGTFEDVTQAAGLAGALYVTGGSFGDLDNDGWPDLYVGTGAPDYRALVPNRMFRNTGTGSFQETTTAAGVGHLQKAGAVSFGDVDNDGYTDVYVVIGGEFPGDAFRNALFLNPGGPSPWVTLRLEGTASNRSALGARIHLVIETGSGDRDVYATVSSGGSFGASTLQQEIGLGDARSIRSVEVRWPATGKREVFSDVPRGRISKLREGSGRVAPVDVERLHLRPEEDPLERHLVH
jgi:hypothetical protein